jgi:ABC-type xylose transport system permease subunit
MKTIGNTLIVVAIFLAIFETILFGGNFLPKTIAELICDISIFTMFIIGMVLKINEDNSNS